MHISLRLHLLGGLRFQPAVVWCAVRATMSGYANAWRACRERDQLAGLDDRSRDDIRGHRVAAELARPVGAPVPQALKTNVCP